MIARVASRCMRWWVLLVLATALAGGCSSSPTAPPPPGNGEVEPNDTTPQNLGTLTADLTITGTASGTGDVDNFNVTLANPASLYVSLAWSGPQDLEVGISDANGVLIHNQDAGNPEQCTVAGRPAGTYRIRVGSFSGSAVTYQLTIGPR